MPRKISCPTVIPAQGNKPKTIEEFIGRVNSGTGEVSIARMTSPGGWIEPGQCPEFNEYTVVLEGMLRVESDGGVLDVVAGEAVITMAGEWVRYSTPERAGARYIAVPACPVNRRVFADDTVAHALGRLRILPPAAL
jgi:quercetin dioxygenase-like cupin family protein